jgi:beta-lactamase regulating signal transducer with metallopeptidase domain/protocatechuate 3,4-dioxygenase beta subunit
MLAVTVADLNGWGGAWVAWLVATVVDATMVLLVAALVWLAVRRRVAAALGSVLFLLVLIKLVVPLEIAVPEAVARWAPRQVVSRWLAGSSVQEVVASVDSAEPKGDDVSGTTVVSERFEESGQWLADESPLQPLSDPDLATVGPSPIDRGPHADREPQYSGADMLAADASATAPIVETASEVDVGAANELATAPETGPSLAGFLMLAWLAIVAGLLARSAWFHLRFCRQLGLGRNIGPEELPIDLGELQCRMGVKRRVRVVEADTLSSPAVCGIIRPVIVLPKGLLGSIPPGQLEWIFLHELAHIRRHDLVVVWFQWIMGIIHLLNPAVWIANRIVNRLREYACDDLALAHTNVSRLDSSEAFMTVVRHAASRPAALSGVPGVFDESARASCFRRMTRLLDGNRQLRVRLSVGSVAIVVLAAALALPQLRPVRTTTAAEPPAATEDPESQQAPPAHLTGTVLNQEGRPIAGCKVQLFVFDTLRDDWSAPVTTSAEGHFSLDVSSEELMGRCQGSAVRAVSPDGRRIGIAAIGNPVGRSYLFEAIDKSRTITLMPVCETTVEVHDGKGQPVVGAQVEALVEFLRNLPSFIAAPTDESGTTRLNIPEGVSIRDVIALKPGAGFDYFGNRLRNESVSLDFREARFRLAERLPERLKFVLDGAMSYRLQLKDEQGEPIVGIPLSPHVLNKPGKPEDLNTGYARTTKIATDSHGIATFPWIPPVLERDSVHLLERGSGHIQFTRSHRQLPTFQDLEVAVKQSNENAPAADSTVVVKRPAFVTGRVTNTQGTPLAGVLVYCQYLRVLTGKDGTYRLPVVPAGEAGGPSRIVDFSAAGWAFRSVEIDAPKPNGLVENVDCTLDRGVAVELRMVIDGGEKSYSEFLQEFHEQGRSTSSGPAVNLSRTADERGARYHRFLPFDGNGACVVRLEPGTYRSNTQVPGLVMEWESLVRDFVVPEEMESEDGLTIEFRGTAAAVKDYRLRFVRSDAPEVGVAGVEVSLPKETRSAVWRRMRTDGKGCVLVRRSEGRLGYLAKTADGQWAAMELIAPKVLVADDKQAPVDITITLKPSATLTGRFVDGRGKPISKAIVRIEPRETTDARSDRTAFRNLFSPVNLEFFREVKADGRFEFTGLPVGIRFFVSCRVAEPEPGNGNESGARTVGSKWITVHEAGIVDMGDIGCEQEPALDDHRRPSQTAGVAETLDVAAAEKAIVEAATRTAGSFRGTVLGSQGTPVAGCTVQFSDYSSTQCEWFEPVTTDVEGRFQLPIPAESLASYSRTSAVRAVSPDKRQMALAAVEPSIGDSFLVDALDVPLTLRLMPLRATTVEVRDERGEPVAGAKVEGLVDFAQRLPSFIAADTDESGKTQLLIPEGVRVRDVIALKPGVGLDYHSNHGTRMSVRLEFLADHERAADRLPESIQLVLDGALTYRAQFKDSTGDPISGRWVSPWILQKVGKAHSLNASMARTTAVVTDSRGVATFPWIPQQLEGGQIQLTTAPDKHRFEVKQAGQAGSAPDLVIELPTPAEVSGRVTDSDGGPVAGVLVWGAGPRCFTGDDGRYRIKVTPSATARNAKRGLRLRAEGWALDTISMTAPGPGEVIENVDGVLKKGTIVRVQVVVDGSKTAFSKVLERIRKLGWNPSRGPVARLRRSAGEHGGTMHATLPIDDEGCCEVRLGPGSYSMSIHIPYFTIEESTKTLYFVVPEESAGDEPLALEVRARAVPTKDHRFRVVRSDASDVGAGGTTIAFNPDLPAGLHNWRRLRTDADGRALVRRSEGPLGYFARSEDGQWAAMGAVEAKDLSEDGGAGSDEITVTMERTATVKGRFIDQQGDPISEGTVKLKPRETCNGKTLHDICRDRSIPGYFCRARDDGSFEFAGVVAGIRYNVLLLQENETVSPGGARSVGYRSVGSRRFTVNESSTVDLGDIECKDRSIEAVEPVKPIEPPHPFHVAAKTFEGLGLR